MGVALFPCVLAPTFLAPPTAVELLVFELDDIRYALRLDVVHEVVRAVAVTPLAGAPPVVHGLIDVRGTVTPVFDLRARLGTPSRGIEPADQFILAHAAGRPVALQVDRVEWMVEADDTAIAEAARMMPAAPFIAGVARLPDGLALIHDLATFLSEDEARALDRALGDAHHVESGAA